jgi:hypothetical protein
MKKLLIAMVMILVLLLSLNVQAGQPLGSPGNIDPRIAPPNSNAFGKSLEEWTLLYWRSYLTGGPPSVGPVYFLPLPDCDEFIPGDPPTCRGQLDLTIEAGTPFMLPIIAWIMEYFTDISDCDEPLPDEVFTDAVATVTIDGREIMENIEEYYVPPVEFDPLITYGVPPNGYIGACRVQGLAFLSMPLQPGEHVITNYVEYIVPDFFGIIYDNTWNITVVP